MRRVLPTAEFVNAKGAVSSADFPHVVTESRVFFTDRRIFTARER
jgi:hypothetical protein